MNHEWDDERTLDVIVEQLKKAKENGRPGCTLLIGAGCSVTAGIPLAAELCAEIRKKWPEASKFAAKSPNEKPSYNALMGVLTANERREIIAEHINKAKINWAHLAIAELMNSGFVDRVLTTNFDPLVLRACSLADVNIGVYDMANMEIFKPAYIADKAVFYLHGQHNGFVTFNSSEEVEKLSLSIPELFKDSVAQRPLIVVGYSGEHDQVFDALTKIERFEHHLYWIGFNDDEPPQHVRERLLDAEKAAFYVKGYDADRFFIKLAQTLSVGAEKKDQCFPPQWISEPFSYLKTMLGQIVKTYPLVHEMGFNIQDIPIEIVNQAINTYETSGQDKHLRANKQLACGEYEVLAQTTTTEEDQETYKILVAWANVLWGNAFAEQAKAKSGADADELYQQAGKKYAQALAIKADISEIWYNWGITLLIQSRTKSDTEANALCQQASNKFARTLEIKQDSYEALDNWGNALSAQAKTKSGAEADTLYRQAGEKYQQALNIKPDWHSALYNWGNALTTQAGIKNKPGAEVDAEELYQQAGEMYERALEIKPDMQAALNNWVVALIAQAQSKSGDERQKLLNQALEKLTQYEALAGCYSLAWIYALLGDEANCQKYLEKARLAQTLPDKAHIEAESALDSMREKPWFKDWFKGLI